MIVAYLKSRQLQCQSITAGNEKLLADAAWIDLIIPSLEEELLIEQFLGIDIPTREEMQEIEPSNRLYEDNGTLFMTATMLAKSDSPEPKVDAVTCILHQEKLITVRYIEPLAFSLFISRLPKISAVANGLGLRLFIELLEVTIDRLADILEKIAKNLDEFSLKIFRPQQQPNDPSRLNYKKTLQSIGASGDLNTKALESIMSFNRLIVFFTRVAATSFTGDMQARLSSASMDIKALHDHVDHLTTKVNFLLDATLGMVNIDQNNIIKIFSIIAVILLPPTLVASIYGMNFHHMPELDWYFGYPLSLAVMFISAWLPYKFFKVKKWL